MGELVTLREAARHFKVSPTTFSRWVTRYGLPVIRVNARVARFRLSEVEQAIDRRNTGEHRCE